MAASNLYLKKHAQIKMYACTNEGSLDSSQFAVGVDLPHKWNAAG